MKTGLENKRNVVILIVLLVIMAGCAVYFVRSVFVGGSPPPSSAQQQAPAASATNPGGAGPEARKIPALTSLDPTLHPELMAGAESFVYNGSGRNIFSMSSAPVQKIEHVIGPVRPTNMTAANTHTGPPPPPPIDLTFFGYEAENGTKQAFLLHSGDVFIAKEGDVVDHHYKVLRINPLSIMVTDLLYNDTQTLPLVQMHS
ncbi:MAG: hypothetical protein WCC14_08400 [Acidobacteriaceae bacterium]